MGEPTQVKIKNGRAGPDKDKENTKKLPINPSIIIIIVVKLKQHHYYYY